MGRFAGDFRLQRSTIHRSKAGYGAEGSHRRTHVTKSLCVIAHPISFCKKGWAIILATCPIPNVRLRTNTFGHPHLNTAFSQKGSTSVAMRLSYAQPSFFRFSKTCLRLKTPRTPSH